MTAGAALYNFFSSFGISAYASTELPAEVQFPYLTYENTQSSWNSSGAPITVNLWYYGSSEAVPNAKAEEIRDALKNGGVTLPCDDGMIWLVLGEPWCQSLTDDEDHKVKRRYINITRFDNRV